jgi:hypothetical protein
MTSQSSRPSRTSQSSRPSQTSLSSRVLRSYSHKGYHRQ